jgi:hypothetical protein
MKRWTLAAPLAALALGACATSGTPDRAAMYVPRIAVPFGYFSSPNVSAFPAASSAVATSEKPFITVPFGYFSMPGASAFPPAAPAVPAKDATQANRARFEERIGQYTERRDRETARQDELDRATRDRDLYGPGPAQRPEAGGN